jgi:hypothetical protein
MSRAEEVDAVLAGPPTTQSNAHRAQPPAPPMQRRTAGPNFVKATDLMAKEMPELRWAVRGIQPEGLTLLVGRPKLGKTWLVDELAIASAAGGRALGQIPVEAADTLLAPLEDPERRTKSRLGAILDGGACPDRLTVASSWPRFDQGGLDWTEAWAKKHPGGRIYFDTFARIRPAASRNGTLYSDDYAALAGLQTLAGRYSLAVMVVHHTRKMASDDPLETVSGTQGLTGAADTILVLRRERAHRDAILFVTGRDVEESEITLRWDPGRCRWSLLGEALSEEREAVMVLLKHAGKPLAIKEIGLALGRPYDRAKVLCWRMASAGQILTEGKGLYSYNPRTLVTRETSETGVTAETVDTGNTETVSRYPGFQGLREEADLEDEAALLSVVAWPDEALEQ